MKADIDKIFFEMIPQIKSSQADLDRQNLWWSVVSIVGKVNNQDMEGSLLEAISDTQQKFEELSGKLIERVVKRYQHKTSLDLKLRAQAFIDIFNRNLFERTADVGFLSTDEKLRDFLMLANPAPEDVAVIEDYLEEYVAKYSVYQDIVVLNKELEVVARLNQDSGQNSSKSPVLYEALSTSDYIECDQPIDVMPQLGAPLTYIQRIEKQGQVLGLLCLSFKMDDELDRIYQMLSQEAPFHFALVNEDNQVLYKTVEDISLPKQEGKLEVVGSNKQAKFTSSTRAAGYQGYMGLPWRGVVNIKATDQIGQADLSENLALEESSCHFPQDLNELNLEISTALLIVILNGKIMSLKNDVKSFLPVLDSFQEIGEDVRHTFSSSIDQIHHVAYNMVQWETAFVAKLSMDIMDRNLYERANDCRWWALNDVFREAISQEVTTVSRQKMTDVLQYINSLYTVYTNIFVYDLSARIQAVSNPNESSLIGQFISNKQEVQSALRLDTTQLYSVSEFEETPLYDNRATYIYHAAIRHPENPNEIVGGMGLVFDSEPEFLAILNDLLPRDEEGNPYYGAFAMFVSEDARVVAVTENGQGILVGSECQALKKIPMNVGENGSIHMEFCDKRYIVGYQVSSGYREYKNNDGYENLLTALVFVES